MKKHISIHISGILFQVEEEAFEELKAYLSRTSKYFSAIDGGNDVLADIESRIAEFFISRLSEYKEYITLEDVADLKQALGTPEDFEEAGLEAAKEQSGGGRRLYRDEQRRLLGGVASGVAHYFSMDPLWVRLAFLLVLFDFSSFNGITGAAVVAYLLCWALLPGSYSLEYSEQLQRLFRDPEEKVVGGVASGLAAYFNIAPSAVRIIFFLSMFAGGLGLLTYLVLWAITPEARTLTERMQMRGEPITLENIERKVKERLHIREGEPESTLARVLLLPFRLVAAALERMGNGLDHKLLMHKGVRVALFLAGSGIALVATAASVAIFGSFAVLAGLASMPSGSVMIDEIPLAMVQRTVPLGVLAFTFLVAWVPTLLLQIAGVSIAARRMVVRPLVSWSLLGLWVVGIVGASVTVPVFASNFQAEGTYKQLQTLALPQQEALRIMLKDERYTDYGPFAGVHLVIKGHDKPEAELVQKYSAKGCSRQAAVGHASRIQYTLEMRDSTLILSPGIQLDEAEPFRNQNLWLELYMPYGREFVMSAEIGNIIRNTLHRHGYTVEDLGLQQRWVYEEDGLHCLTCKEVRPPATPDAPAASGQEEVSSATTVMVEGIGSVIFRQGPKPSIEIEGNGEGFRKVRVRQQNGVLSVRNRHLPNARIVIVQPDMANLHLEGPMQVVLEQLRQENLNLFLSEATELDATVFVQNLNLTATEGVQATLQGAGANVNIKAAEGVELHATAFAAEHLRATASEGSHLNLGPAAHVQANADESSSIE